MVGDFLIAELVRLFFFFKQKTAYDMRISDWSSDVCSSDLNGIAHDPPDRLKVSVARHELGEAVGDCDDRLAEVGCGDSGGAQEGTGTGHVATVGDDVGEIGRASCRERVCQYV